MKKFSFFISITYITIFLLLSILVPIISNYNITEIDLDNTYLKFGNKKHIFGTDSLGRDLFVRIWYGGRISIIIAIIAIIVDISVGIPYGIISGYVSGYLNIILIRVLDILQGIPFILIAILLSVIFEPGLLTISFAYILIGWTIMARQIRASVLKVKTNNYKVS